MRKHPNSHREAKATAPVLDSTRFFALSAAIALNIRLRVCLTVATPFDRMACKVKS